MHISKEYLRLLKEFEGFIAKPYLCPAGVCTIGYGTNLEAHREYIPYTEIRNSNVTGDVLRKKLVNLGMEWTTLQAEKAMLEELEQTHKALLNSNNTYVLLRTRNETCRAEALLDMAYNMGVYGLSKFAKTLNLIEHEQYEEASKNLKNTRWYKQVGRRSKAISKMIATGTYPDLSEV